MTGKKIEKTSEIKKWIDNTQEYFNNIETSINMD
jgi:hypothetical protein